MNKDLPLVLYGLLVILPIWTPLAIITLYLLKQRKKKALFAQICSEEGISLSFPTPQSFHIASTTSPLGVTLPAHVALTIPAFLKLLPPSANDPLPPT